MSSAGWLCPQHTLLSSYTTIIDRHDLKSSPHIVYRSYQLLKLLERYCLLIWSCRWGVHGMTFRAFSLPAEIYWLRPFYHLKLRAPAPLTVRENFVDTRRGRLILWRGLETILSLPSVEMEKMSSAGWLCPQHTPLSSLIHHHHWSTWPKTKSTYSVPFISTIKAFRTVLLTDLKLPVRSPWGNFQIFFPYLQIYTDLEHYIT